MAIAASSKELYELLDRNSPSKATFQTDGGSATMDFIIERKKVGYVIEDILGSVYKSGNGC